MNTLRFDPRELCSRKLWQLVSTETDQQVSERELREAITELANRRHYLEQLQQIGAIKGQNAGA
jgi:PleD family two-component response regulator